MLLYPLPMDSRLASAARWDWEICIALAATDGWIGVMARSPALSDSEWVYVRCADVALNRVPRVTLLLLLLLFCCCCSAAGALLVGRRGRVSSGCDRVGVVVLLLGVLCASLAALL